MRKILLSLLLAAATSGPALADDGKPFPHIGWRPAGNLSGAGFCGGEREHYFS